MLQKDRMIVRELAKQYMELACSEEQQQANRRMRDSNDLKIVRPPVLIDEIPWEQMDIDGELICRCENEEARKAEEFLRRQLYRKKHLKTDYLFEPFYRVDIAVESSGIGIERKVQEVSSGDPHGDLTAHSFED
ncbi:MAG: hypothetical protein ACI4LH_03090, partial [Candidatus Heritagella sp.]